VLKVRVLLTAALCASQNYYRKPERASAEHDVLRIGGDGTWYRQRGSGTASARKAAKVPFGMPTSLGAGRRLGFSRDAGLVYQFCQD